MRRAAITFLAAVVCLVTYGLVVSMGQIITGGGGGGGGGGALAVQVGGVAVGTRAILNFASGTGLTQACVDNPGATRVDCTPTINAAFTQTNDRTSAGTCVAPVLTSSGTTTFLASYASACKALTTYTTNMQVNFTPDTTCLTSCTLNLDSQGNKAIKRSDGTTDPGGAIVAGRTYPLTYDGIVFRMFQGTELNNTQSFNFFYNRTSNTVITIVASGVINCGTLAVTLSTNATLTVVPVTGVPLGTSLWVYFDCNANAMVVNDSNASVAADVTPVGINIGSGNATSFAIGTNVYPIVKITGGNNTLHQFDTAPFTDARGGVIVPWFACSTNMICSTNPATGQTLLSAQPSSFLDQTIIGWREDFNTSATAGSTVGRFIRSQAAGTPVLSFTSANTDANHPIVFQVQTGAVSGNDVEITDSPSGTTALFYTNLSNTAGWRADMYLKIPVVTTISFGGGWQDANSGADVQTNSIKFRYSTAIPDPSIVLATCKAGACVATPSGVVPTAGVWYKISLYSNVVGTIAMDVLPAGGSVTTITQCAASCTGLNTDFPLATTNMSFMMTLVTRQAAAATMLLSHILFQWTGLTQP